MNTRALTATLFLLAALLAFAPQRTRAQEAIDTGTQTAALLHEEAEAVYHANRVRREHGAPPLRWNAQLTAAARWFSWDSVANRADPYCGHQDTQGNWPDVRAQRAGYAGVSGAENAYCGYLRGEDAVAGWMNSEGHRANLLDPASREVGLGYYFDAAKNRGYVTQDFGHDPAYAPVVIDNEALATTSSQVELYIYAAETAEGLQGRSETVAMQVSNDRCFTGAAWEPYAETKAWTLAAGDAGWRTVSVQTRDRFNRTATVQDSIYFGANLPEDAMATMPFSTSQPEVTLSGLDGGDLPMMQFSPGWLADDSAAGFRLWWGGGARVNDDAALGGTAFRLTPGSGESYAWVFDTNFIKDVPFVAYFRLKVDDNRSSSEVARIAVKGGGVEYGPRTLRGSDFAQPGVYQEFAVPFTFHSNAADPFLTFQIWRSGSVAVSFDVVTVFTAPVPVSSTYTWRLPGGNYRGQGVWVRYTDGASNFTAWRDATSMQRTFAASPASLTTLLAAEAPAPAPTRIAITAQCVGHWQAHTSASWLTLETVDGALLVTIDSAALAIGSHTADIVLTTDDPATAEVRIPVNVHKVETLSSLYLPLVGR